MSNSSTLVLGGVVMLVLFAFLLSSFVRHLRWEERLLRWRIRIFFHCLAFVLIAAGGAYFYLTQ